jgi:tRNA A-37 threonylcarbamoyl transferase component Bud32
MSRKTPLVTRMERTSSSDSRVQSPGLPEDLLRDSARRLRVIALIYAGGFLLATIAEALVDPIARENIARFSWWGADLASIAFALMVAGLASNRRIHPATVMNIGLVFEVVAAYGIAFSTYWGRYQGLEYVPEHLGLFGLSYVAPWIMFFTIVSPNLPRRALIAAIAAGSSVPVTLLLTIRYGGTSIVLTPAVLINNILVPYLMIVVTAWVGALVVYRLGTAVTKAREMGSYRLTERLGGGGMGEVWRAKHRMLARPAAIKLIRPDKLGGDDRDIQSTLRHRFEREAQATALMHSPHTIDVYDFGVTADGTFYYVMELLNGFDLETLVERFGPMPPERAVYLLRQVCDSLMEAHEHDLIHRDIKPANICLCRQGRPVDFVKLLDFGLVRPQKQYGPDDVKLTAEHEASGTPAYMAPEQALGDPVDGRTDIYAVGCVAYWLVTGQLVFQCDSPMTTMAHHLNKEPVPPSQCSDLPISKELDGLILSCLEKDPSRRPQTAQQLDALLSACALDKVWTPGLARDWWELHEPTAVADRETAGEQIQVV